MDFSFFIEVSARILHGIPLTLLLAVAAIGLGFVIALLTALSIVFRVPLLDPISRGYIYFIRSTPLLIQLFFIYYGLGQIPAIRDSFLWPILKSPMWCSIIALALNTGAFSGEIFRGAFVSVPAGQIEAGKAGGMSWWLRFRRIIFPVGMRIALPSYGNELVMIIKATALASTVTIMEVTGIAHKLINETYRPIEVFAIAGAFYLLINIGMTRFLKTVETRVSQHL